MSSVALIGSSGGGGATLGHTDPVQLLTTIHVELGRIKLHRYNNNNNNNNISNNRDRNDDETTCHGLKHALFVSLDGGKGMDSANPDHDRATLYAVGCQHKDGPEQHTGFRVRKELTGTLRDVNDRCRELQNRFLVPSIDGTTTTDPSGTAGGDVTGLICISCDPLDVNAPTLSAAASSRTPITGSGGSSLSAMAAYTRNSSSAGTGMGLRIVGNAGGSVATTTYTRAVSYCQALADAWGNGCEYDPRFESGNDGGVSGGGAGVGDGDGDVEATIGQQGIRIGSVLDACLPAFLAVCLAVRVLESIRDLSFPWMLPLSRLHHYIVLTFGRNYRSPMDATYDAGDVEPEFLLSPLALLEIDRLIHQLRYQALPSVCAVVTATSYSPQHGSTAVMASVIASMACSGSILSGLLAGWIVSFLLGRVLFRCIKLQIPATMSNIISAGGIGICTALLLTTSGVVLALGWITRTIRTVVQTSPASYFESSLLPWDGTTGLGFVLGCVFVYGSKVGWYHTFFLPIILIEMEHGNASLWGSIDVCTLVMVSAGVCAGNLLVPFLVVSGENMLVGDTDSTTFTDNGGDRDDNADAVGCISKRGLIVNVLCGDFIEVAYPFMEQSQIVNLSAYLGSGIATEILVSSCSTQVGNNCSVLSSAYLPIVGSIALAADWRRMALAIICVFVCSMSGTIIGNIIRRQRRQLCHQNKLKHKQG